MELLLAIMCMKDLVKIKITTLYISWEADIAVNPLCLLQYNLAIKDHLRIWAHQNISCLTLTQRDLEFYQLMSKKTLYFTTGQSSE